MPSSRIVCKVEGRSLLSCQYCYVVWRAKVRDENSHVLASRCPACADWHPARYVPADSPRHQPLSGDAADVINRAMWAEGMLEDVRKRVLVRLGTEAPWLQALVAVSL